MSTPLGQERDPLSRPAEIKRRCVRLQRVAPVHSASARWGSIAKQTIVEDAEAEEVAEVAMPEEEFADDDDARLLEETLMEDAPPLGLRALTRTLR